MSTKSNSLTFLIPISVIFTLILINTSCTKEISPLGDEGSSLPMSAELVNSYNVTTNMIQIFPIGKRVHDLMNTTYIPDKEVQILKKTNKTYKDGEVNILTLTADDDTITIQFGYQKSNDTTYGSFLYADSSNIIWHIEVKVFSDDAGRPSEYGEIWRDGVPQTKVLYYAYLEDSSVYINYEFPYYNFKTSGNVHIAEDTEPEVVNVLADFYQAHPEVLDYYKDINPYAIDYAIGAMAKDEKIAVKKTADWLSWAGGVITGIAGSIIVGPWAGAIGGALYSAINTYVNTH